MAVHPGSLWLDRNWNELRGYNNMWVAAHADGFITGAESLDDLLRALKFGGVFVQDSLEDVTLAFVSFDINQ